MSKQQTNQTLEFDLTYDEVDIIEEWTGLRIGNVLFDSKIHKWGSGESEYLKKLQGKERLVFLIEDEKGNVYGGYVKIKIERVDDDLEDCDAFVFLLKKNGNSNYIKYEKKIAFHLCNDKQGDNSGLFGFGFAPNFDIYVCKNNDLSSYCNANTFWGCNFSCCEAKEYFEPQRIVVIEMKNVRNTEKTEEQNNTKKQLEDIRIEGKFEIENFLFSGFENLTKINIPSTVKIIGDFCFKGCGLTTLTIPENVKEIGKYAFKNNKELIKVKISEGLEGLPDGMFSGCSKLSRINIPSTIVKIGDDCFNGCDLESLTIPRTVTEIGGYAFCNNKKLGLVELKDGLKVLSDGMFSGCSILKKISIPSTVERIGNRCFNECQLLHSKTPLMIPSTVKVIGNYTFKSNYQVKKVQLPEYNQQIEALQGVETETGQKVPTTLFSERIPDGMFFKCRNLSTVNIPTTATEIGENCFNGCNLTSLTIPESVKAIGSYAFCENRNLFSVVLGNKITELSNKMFFGCYSLESIVIPDSVEKIGESCFSGCNLTKLTIPSKVKYIGNGAFKNNFELQEIELKSVMEEFSDFIFCGCSNLTKINTTATITKLGKNCFERPYSEISNVIVATSGVQPTTQDKKVSHSGKYRICYKLFNVRIGDCAVVTIEAEKKEEKGWDVLKTILIDAGPKENKTFYSSKQLIELYLEEKEVFNKNKPLVFDAIVISHWDDDNVGGLAECGFKTDYLLCPSSGYIKNVVNNLKGENGDPLRPNQIKVGLDIFDDATKGNANTIKEKKSLLDYVFSGEQLKKSMIQKKGIDIWLLGVDSYVVGVQGKIRENKMEKNESSISMLIKTHGCNLLTCGDLGKNCDREVRKYLDGQGIKNIDIFKLHRKGCDENNNTDSLKVHNYLLFTSNTNGVRDNVLNFIKDTNNFKGNYFFVGQRDVTNTKKKGVFIEMGDKLEELKED